MKKRLTYLLPLLILILAFSFSCSRGGGSSNPEDMLTSAFTATITGKVESSKFTGNATLKLTDGRTLSASITGDATGAIDGDITGSFSGKIENNTLKIEADSATAITTAVEGGTINGTVSLTDPATSSAIKITVQGTPPDTTPVAGTFTGTVSGTNFSGTFTSQDGTTTGTISGTVTGDVQGTISGTITGTINNDTSVFTGTTSGTYTGLSSGSGTFSGSLVYQGLTTNVSGNLTGDGSYTTVSNSQGTAVVNSDLTFATSGGGITVGSVTINVSGNVPSDGGAGNATITLNGIVSNNNEFDGTITISYPSTGTSTTQSNITLNINGTSSTAQANFVGTGTIPTVTAISGTFTANVNGTQVNGTYTNTSNGTTGTITGTLSKAVKGPISGTLSGSHSTDGTIAVSSISGKSPGLTGSTNVMTATLTYKSSSGSANCTLTGDGTYTTVNNVTVTTTLDGSGNFNVTTNVDGTNIVISGNVPGGASGSTITITLNGYVDNNGTFHGTITVSFPSTGTGTTQGNVTVTVGSTTTTINTTFTGDGSIVIINGTFTGNVAVGQTSITGTYTPTSGSSQNLNATVAGNIAGAVNITLNGQIQNGTFTGTATGTFPGTTGSNGTVTIAFPQGNVEASLEGDGTITTTNGGDHTSDEPTTDVSNPYNYYNEDLPSDIQDAIVNAINSGQNAVIYWKTNYRWQPVKTGSYSSQHFWNDPNGTHEQYRGDYRAIKIIHNTDGTNVTIYFGWYDIKPTNSTYNVVPLMTIGFSPVFTGEGTVYIKHDYKKAGQSDIDKILFHAKQYFYLNGVIWE